jgi:putative Mg2+ transporter-C (MgtC) family protein
MTDFSDWLSWLSQRYPELRLELLGRLLLAAVLGGAIGWEREAARKPAGLRTNVLICLGAALLTDLSVLASTMGTGPSDPGRIAAQIVTGVGFLGAGTIMQARGGVTGLTTAATLWVVAASGMAVGCGAQVEAVGGTALVLVALIPLRALEARAGNRRRTDRRSDRAPADQGGDRGGVDDPSP